MSKSIRQLHNDFPRYWWRSAGWWRAAAKQDATAVLTLIAPVLLTHKAVFAVRHRRNPVQLSRINGESFAYGVAGSIALLVMLAWTSAGRAGMFPLVLGMGSVLTLNVLVSGTVVAVLAGSRARERPDWSAIDFVERNGAHGRPPETPDEDEAERMKVLLTGPAS
ncbi:hypothetical protein [Arthrobacter pigmenti]